MKAEELMIGDWVCYSIPNKYYTKIQEIRCTQDGEEYYIRCHRDAKDTFLEQLKYDDFSVDIIHPIPLTPEILEKNGFVLKHDGWLWCEEEGSEEQNYIFIQFRKGCDEVRIVELNFVNNVLAKFRTIQFVHELQHALKLCGITKEIVLCHRKIKICY